MVFCKSGRPGAPGHIASGGTSDAALDRLTKLAARYFKVPAAAAAACGAGGMRLVSWFGVEDPVDLPFDPEWRVPVELRETVSGFRFYAAAPLAAAGGRSAGVFAILDTAPRAPLSESEREALAEFAASAAALLDRPVPELLAATLEALPVGVWIANADGEILLGNRAGREIWAGARYLGFDGYGEYKAWRSGTGEPVQPHEWGMYRAIRHGETSSDELLDIECFDGSRKTVLHSAAPLRSAEGAIAGGIVVIQDVTAKHEASRELLRRERQLEALSRATQDINAELDIPLILRRLIAAARDLAGAEGGAAGLLENGRMVFREYDRAGTVFPISYTFESGYGVPGHVIATRRTYVSDDAGRDPHVIPEIQAALGFRNLIDVPIFDRHGELIGCFEMHNSPSSGEAMRQDAELLETLAAGAAVAIENARILADRNAAEEALRRASDTVKAIIQSAPLAIISTGPDSTVRSWNPAAERLFGWKAEEVIGRAYPCIGPEAWDDHRQRQRSILEGNAFAGVPLVRMRKDGTPVHVSFSAAPLHGPDGTCNGVLGILADITEQKRAEEGLRQSEEHLRLTLESSPLGIVTALPDGTLRTVNKSFCVLLGREPHELLGKHFHVLVCPEERRAVEENLNALVRGEISHSEIEARVVRSDGTLVDVVIRGGVVRTPSGEALFVSGVLEDVTGVKRSREALRQSEERYRVLVEASPDAIAVHRDNRVLYVNPAALRLYGAKSAAELVGTAPLDRVHPEYLPAVRKRIGSLERGREGVPTLDEKHFRLDGSLLDVEVISTVCLHEGRPAVQAVVRDVSERKRAEEALRQSEMHFRAVFDGSLDGLFILDAEWRYADVNPAGCRLLGCPAAEIIGKPFGSFSGSDDQNVLRVAMGKAVMEGGQRGLVHWTRADGVQTVLDFGIQPDFLPGRHLVTMRDITEQTRLEQQFRQAQKMEAVGRLAGGVAHDFNNLLTIIAGYTQMTLEQLRPGDPLREDILEIDKAGERAAGLTRQLLAFSRNQVMQPRVLDLNAVIADTERMLRRVIGEDIELVTSLPADLGRVRVDAGQFVQVIVNLAVNARDAMPRGGLLRIETQNVEFTRPSPHHPLPPGAYVGISVSDTGTGMDSETLTHIFEPFFTTKEKGKGTGLGLSTVYGIVKQSGGDVRVYSQPGRGSTFRIYLPREEEAGETEAAGAVSAPLPVGTETVLVVEDDAPVRALVCGVLRASGYRVIEAADGRQALDRSGEFPEPIHLMVADVVMPGLNGFELARLLAPSRPGMRVLHVSGYTDAHTEVAADPQRFLQKPFTPRALAAKVREALDRK